MAFIKVALILGLACLMPWIIRGEPIPAVAPGCLKLCQNDADCLDDCPTITSCKNAMANQDNLPERYHSSASYEPRLLLCSKHCLGGNQYVDKACMRDCPRTWCVKFGEIPQTATTAATTTLQRAPPSHIAPTPGDPKASSSQTSGGFSPMGIGILCLVVIGVAVPAVTLSIAFHIRRRSDNSRRTPEDDESPREKDSSDAIHGEPVEDNVPHTYTVQNPEGYGPPIQPTPGARAIIEPTPASPLIVPGTHGVVD